MTESIWVALFPDSGRENPYLDLPEADLAWRSVRICSLSNWLFWARVREM